MPTKFYALVYFVLVASPVPALSQVVDKCAPIYLQSKKSYSNLLSEWIIVEPYRRPPDGVSKKLGRILDEFDLFAYRASHNYIKSLKLDDRLFNRIAHPNFCLLDIQEIREQQLPQSIKIAEELGLSSFTLGEMYIQSPSLQLKEIFIFTDKELNRLQVIPKIDVTSNYDNINEFFDGERLKSNSWGKLTAIGKSITLGADGEKNAAREILYKMRNFMSGDDEFLPLVSDLIDQYEI